MTSWHVEMVNLDDRVALRSDGLTGRVTLMLDADGEDTDETGDAVAVVVGWPDGLWSALPLDGMERVNPF